MVDHFFGGDWTEVKLEILQKYLSFYTTAFKNQRFNSIYIDAFAGTGERQQKIPAAPLLNEEERIETLAGSAKIALSINNPFNKYIFIEEKKSRIKRLKEVASKYPSQSCEFYKNDANIELEKICKNINWKNNRAVLFLDPYGLSVNWETLQLIQSTQAVDIWFLFSLSGLFRQAAINYDSIESYKIKKLNMILGTEDWQKIFYSENKSGITDDLFESHETKLERSASVRDLERYIQERLSALFPYVSKPLPLPKTGAQLYSLFLCVSNPSPKATALAKKVSNFILKPH